MKNFNFLSAVLLAAASVTGVCAQDMRTGVVLSDPAYGDLEAPVYLNVKYSCSQMLYTGQEMDNASGSLDKYTIAQLHFPFKGSLSNGGTAKIKVFMATSSLTSLDAVVPMDEFRPVFNGEVELTPDMTGMTIDLDSPFVMNKGEGVVIATSAEAGGMWIQFQDPFPGGVRSWKSWSADTPRDFVTGMTKREGCAGLTIGYYEGEWTGTVVPETVDLKAVSVTGPEKVSVGSAAALGISVENLGTATASGYKVMLLDAGTGQTVAEIDDCPDIQGGLVTKLTTDIRFEEPGTYSYLAEVVCEDDTDISNNITAEPYTVEVVEKGFLPDPMNMNVPAEANAVNNVWFDRNQTCSGSQTIYTSEYFGDLKRDIQLQKLGFNILGQGYAYPDTPIRIYMAQTDRTDGYPAEASGYPGDASVLIPAEEFTLVYEGYFNAPAAPSGTDTFVDIEFDTPFVLEAGKGLAINVFCNSEEDSPLVYFRCAREEGDVYNQVYFRTWRKGYEDFYDAFSGTLGSGTSTFRTNSIPQLALTYALVPQAAVVDLAAGSLTAPATVKLNEVNTFKVSVKNVGTTEVEEMTVELLDMSGDVPKVLESNEVQRMLPAEGSTNVNLKYAFTEAGEYRIAARVIVDGDNDLANDVSETVTVIVEGEPEVIDLEAVSFTGETYVYIGSEQTYRVGVRNSGNVAVDGYSVDIFDGGSMLGTEMSKTVLAPGDEETLEVKVNMPEEECVMTLLARVQVEGDAGYDNNEAELRVEVSRGAGVGSVYTVDGAGYADGMLYPGDGVTHIAVSDMAGRVLLSADVRDGRPVRFGAVSGVYAVTAVSADGVRTYKLKI